MNIISQICGICVLTVLFISFLHQKRVGLHSERVFMHVMAITFLSIFLDMLSLLAIGNREHIPDFLLEMICKSYIATIILVGQAAFSYVLNAVYEEEIFFKKVRTYSTIAIGEVIILFCLPLYVYAEEQMVYTYGPAVIFTYIAAVLFILATLVSLGIHKRVLNKRRMHMVLIWMGIWLLAAVIQFFNNQILVVGFASSLGMLILYCSLENPDNNMDKRVGCFHTHALMEYLKQCYSRKESKSILLISMAGFQTKDISIEFINESIIEFVRFFEKYPEAKVFKNIEQEIIILFDDISKMNQAFQELQDTYFAQYYYKSNNLENDEARIPNTICGLVPDIHIVGSPEELLQLFSYLKLENQHVTGIQVCYVNSMVLDAMRKSENIRQDIIDALDEDRVEIFLQPIFSVKKNKFTSAEVLARIRNIDGSIMSPGVFIPVAEESELITFIGERVFNKTCRFLKEHSVDELGLEYLEVNLSVKQCEQRNLAERYIRIMEEYGISPWWINLEITETGSVQIKKILLENMNELIDYGVSFSLDDFGNGQSNLDYMIDMPVAIMKFDMNMTRSYFENYKAKYVVQSTIHLAHDMELGIVAEGVETKEQLEEMGKVGVDYIQGYYFSKPLAIDEFMDFIKKYSEAGSFVDKQ